MTDLAITTARPVQVVRQHTGPTDETVALGAAVRLNTSTGALTKAKATGAAEARILGVAITAAAYAGQMITIVQEGLVDVGNALGGLNFDDPVYLSNTDGTLADSAGSESVLVGRVVPAWGATTADKLLEVRL